MKLKRHYVTPVIDPVRIANLRLLILLSALITGLTGLIAGQPALARAGEPAAIAAAFAGRIEQTSETVQALRLPGETWSFSDSRRDETNAAQTFIPQSHRVDERRIE